MRYFTRSLLTIAVFGVFSISSPSNAFQVLPKVSDVDRKLAKTSMRNDWLGQYFSSAALPYLKSPVHEAITLVALGCDAEQGEELDCVRTDTVSRHQVVLYGVRWPDDPPFRMASGRPPRSGNCDVAVTLRSTAQPRCWLDLFNDAARDAARAPAGKPAFGPGDMLLYRSHFGDLQFMHSMAAYDGEPAHVTREKMRMWSQFLWGVAIGEVRTDVWLRDTGVPGLGEHFPGDMTATNLLATGIPQVRKHLDQVALGALLHMVQDSFSGAHASRSEPTGGRCEAPSLQDAPGRVAEFHSYTKQDSKVHDTEDTPDALARQTLEILPSVVDVSRELIALWKRKATWGEVDDYLDCVYALSNPATPAGPGRFTRSK